MQKVYTCRFLKSTVDQLRQNTAKFKASANVKFPQGRKETYAYENMGKLPYSKRNEVNVLLGNNIDDLHLQTLVFTIFKLVA